jgi:hypothetical protein
VLLLAGEYDVGLPPQNAAEYAGLFEQAGVGGAARRRALPWLGDPVWFTRALAAFPGWSRRAAASRPPSPRMHRWYACRDQGMAVPRRIRTAGGHPDAAHTHGPGGSGLGAAALALVAAALAVKAAGPVLGAVSEMVHVFLMVAGVAVGAGAAALVSWLSWRRRCPTLAGTGRAMPPLPTKMARPASPLPQKRRAAELPAAGQHEPPGGLHSHLHDVSADDVAAILTREDWPPIRPRRVGAPGNV